MTRRATAWAAALATLWTLSAVHAADPVPNVILILADDQGWADTSVQMDRSIPDSKSDYYQTPNLEALARQGVTFSNAYSPSPICSPTRMSIQTGKSPQSLHITDIIESQPGSKRYSDLYSGKALIPPPPIRNFPKDELTIAQIVKKAHPNAATAHFGKWHMGGGGPGKHGYDENDGNNGNDGAGLNAAPNPKDVTALTDRAIDFMTRQAKAGRPFYMQVWHYAVHQPEIAQPATIAKYEALPKGKKHKNATYAAMNEDLDTAVGRLVKAVDDLGLGKTTYIIYTSDNGGATDFARPPTDNAPLQWGKASVYEGGIRVPFFARGPGIKPNSASNTPIVGWDFLPTICEMMGCTKDLPQGLEGVGMLAALKGSAAAPARPGGGQMVWHFPHYLIAKQTRPQSAIREGNYKLVKHFETGEAKLFDLSKDIGEKNDLAKAQPELARKMESDLMRRLKEQDARMPIENPWRPAP